MFFFGNWRSPLIFVGRLTGKWIYCNTLFRFVRLRCADCETWKDCVMLRDGERIPRS